MGCHDSPSGDIEIQFSFKVALGQD